MTRVQYFDPENELYCTEHDADGCYGRVNYVSEGVDGRAACETHTPQPELEPVDDFDAAYADYLADYLADEAAQTMLSDADYDEGFRDGSTVRGESYTIYAPAGARFTLTVN